MQVHCTILSTFDVFEHVHNQMFGKKHKKGVRWLKKINVCMTKTNESLNKI